MNPIQNLTEINEISEVVEQKLEDDKLLTYQQDMWIDYNALGGLVIDDTGNISKMTVDDFAARLGVSKQTLYNWRKSIKGFWDRVASQRKTLGSQARTVKVYNGLFLKAAAGNPQAAALFLANHDPNFRMPTEKVQHELGDSWSALIRNKNNVIDVPNESKDIPG